MSTDRNQNKEDSCTMKELVTFSHISPLYPAGTDVTIHYTLEAGIHATPVDWIGIVQNGEQDLSKVLVFQWAEVGQEGEGTSTIRSSTFPAKLLEPLAHETQKYQFLYVSNRSLPRGSSQPFMIRSDRCGPDAVTCGPRSAQTEAVSQAVNPCLSASSVTMSSEDEWELAAHSALQDEASGTTDLSDIVILSTSPSKEAARAELDKLEGWCEENLKSLSISTDESPQDSFSDLGDVSKTDENNQTVVKDEEGVKTIANQGNYNKEVAREELDRIKEARDKVIKREGKILTNERMEEKSKRMKKPKYLKKVSHFEMSKPRKGSDSSFIKKATTVVVSDQLTQVKPKCRNEEVSQAVKSCKHDGECEPATLFMKQNKCLDTQQEEKTFEALQVRVVHEAPKKEVGLKQRKAKSRKEKKHSEQPVTLTVKVKTHDTEIENKSVVHEEMRESMKSAIAFDEMKDTKVAKKRKESHKLKVKTKEAVKKSSQVAEISNETCLDSADVKQRNVESLSKRDRELMKEAKRVERMSRRVLKRQVLAEEDVVYAEKDFDNDEDSSDCCAQNRWSVLSSIFGDDITAVAKTSPQKIKSKKKDKTRAKHKQQYLKSLAIDLSAEMEFSHQPKHQTDVRDVIAVSTRKGTEVAKIKDVLEVRKISVKERQNTNSETEADPQTKKPVEEYASEEHSRDTSPDQKTEIGDGSSSPAGLSIRESGSFYLDPTEALFTLGVSPEIDRASSVTSRARSLSHAVRKAKYRHKSPASSSVHRTRVLRRWLCLKGRRERKESCENILDREISSAVQPPSLNEKNGAISKFWKPLPSKSSDQPPVRATAIPVSEGLSWSTTSTATLSAENSKPGSNEVTKSERRPQSIAAFSKASILVGPEDVSSPQKAVPPTAPCLFQASVADPERIAADVFTSGLQDSRASQKVVGTVGDGLPSYASVLKRSKQGIYPQIHTGRHTEVTLRNDLPSNVDRSQQPDVKSAHRTESSSENILYKLPDICSEATPCIRFESSDTKYQDDTAVKSPEVSITESRAPDRAEGVPLSCGEINLSEILNYLPKSATSTNYQTECRIKLPNGFENVSSSTTTFRNGFNEIKYLKDRSLFSERTKDTADIEKSFIWPLAAVVCPPWHGFNFPKFQDEDQTPRDTECEESPTDESLLFRAGCSARVGPTPSLMNDARSGGRCHDCKSLIKSGRSRSGSRHRSPDRHQEPRWSSHENRRLLKHMMNSCKLSLREFKNQIMQIWNSSFVVAFLQYLADCPCIQQGFYNLPSDF